MSFLNGINIAIIFLTLLWLIAPYFKKAATVSMSSSEILAYQSMFILPLNLVRFFKTSNTSLLSVSFNVWFFLSITGTFLSSVTYMYLCKTAKPSDFIPIVQPTVILLTTLIDSYIDKAFNYKKIMASLFIISGLILLKLPETDKQPNMLKIKTNNV